MASQDEKENAAGINVSELGTTHQRNSDVVIGEEEAPVANRPQMTPMSPLAASATVVNLLLATGPFSYPTGYVHLGPFLSCIIMSCTCFLAYISATFMVEAISVAHAKEIEKK